MTRREAQAARDRIEALWGHGVWESDIADCGSLALLAGESQLASEYYTRLLALTGVEGWMYSSAADMLRTVSIALGQFKPDLAERMRTEAEGLSRKS